MACYICLGEGVTTSPTGVCAKCSQLTCGRPPQRRDRQFHGDICSVADCRMFFCEQHMHTHPHARRGVSTTFSALSLAIGIAAATGASRAAKDPTVLRTDSRMLEALNRYLNCVSPGATSLYQMRDRIPVDLFQIDRASDLPVLRLDTQFFSPGAIATVSRMAVRTMWIAASTLRPSRHHDSLLKRLMSWIEPLGERLSTPSIELDQAYSDWLADLLRGVAQPDLTSTVWNDMPDESEREELGLFLLAKRDEGEAAETVTAY